MKFVKIFGVILLLLVVVVGGVTYYVVNNIDGILKTAIETEGSKAVGTDVTLGSIKVDWQQGRITLSDLIIANPPGYTTDYAIAIGTAAVQVDYNSLQTGVITIQEILVDAPRLIAEEKNLTETNLTTLSNNLNKGAAATPSEPSASSGGGDEPLLMVEKFTFSNANIELVSSQYGDRDLTMPAINASNLGAPNGVTAEVLAQQLVDEVLDQATAAVKKATRDAAKEKVRSEVKDKIDEKLSDEDKAKLDDVRSLLKR